jgi:hypothetical protein
VPMVERLSVQCVDLGVVELPAPLVDNGHADDSRDGRKSLPSGPRVVRGGRGHPSRLGSRRAGTIHCFVRDRAKL